MFKELPEWCIFLISIILFSLGFLYGHAEILIYSFTFLIIMEVVRTIYEYIFNPHSRMKVRYAIDGAIFFAIREMFVGWLMLKTNVVLGAIILLISIIGLGAIIFFRTKVIKDSPDNLDSYYK